MKTSAPASIRKTTGNGVRPITVGIPEALYRRVRIYCAARDITLSAFITGLCERSVADLPTELADVMPATLSPSSSLESALSGLVSPAEASEEKQVAS